MKTLKLLALVAVLGLASLASAQTLTRSLVLKPSGSTGTATLTSGSIGVLGDSYTLTLPAGGRAQTGPILKQTNTAVGDKPMIFGQIDLTSNTALTGDVTGTLGVGNGGTGVASIAAGGILLGSGGTTAMTVLSPGTNTSVLTMSSGTPTWSDIDNLNTTAGTAPVTNINAADNNAGSGTESVTNIGYNVPAADVDDEPSTTNINGNTNIGSATGDDGGPTTTTINGNVVLPLTTDNIWVGVGNVATATAPGTAGQVLTIVGTTPTWSSSLGNAGSATTIVGGPLNLNSTGGTTNIATTGTGTTNIGNNAGPSVTNLAGDVNFTSTSPVNFSVMPELPLAQNSMYVGNASNYAQAYATTAERVLTSPGGIPTWSTTLPSAVTVPFNQISSGTNTTAVMVVDGAASLAPANTGTITANRFVTATSTSNAVDLATTEVNGVLPIANGGTNSSTIGGAGTVSYSTGTAYASTAVGASGQLLQSNGAAAPSWVSVGNLLAAASFSVTADAADVTNGYFLINVTEVPTLITGYGYDASSRVMVTLESASGPGQVVTVTNRGAADFRIYTGAIEVGDRVNVVIIDTTP